MRGAFIRFAAYPLGLMLAVALVAALLAYSISRREIVVAKQMMDDVSRLEVEKSGLDDVLAFAHKYNGAATGSWQSHPCLEADCLVMADPDKNDFWERHPKLGYAADRVSRRGWTFVILMWVKDGKLVEIQQWFGYFTTRKNLFVITTHSRPSPGLCRNSSYRLHHAFATYLGPKHFNVWVSPEGKQEKEMLRLDVQCVLRISGCKDLSDMVPGAWRRYEADRPLMDASEVKLQNEIAPDPESECH
jgi:hypothetical protein